MSELIRREDAINAVEMFFEDAYIEDAEVHDLVYKINHIPTASPWHRSEDGLPEPYVQCLVRDNDNNYAVGYYRQDAKAWDSPYFGWIEHEDGVFYDDDLPRIGKVVAWMSLPEPPKEDA